MRERDIYKERDYREQRVGNNGQNGEERIVQGRKKKNIELKVTKTMDV